MEFLALPEEEGGGQHSTLQLGNSCKIFVGNLPFKITNLELTELFITYGTVIGVNIRKDRATDKPKGFAFITFDSPAAATAAIANVHGKSLEGRVLTVKTALARGQSTTDKKLSTQSAAATDGEDDGTWATAPPPRRHRGERNNYGHGSSGGGRGSSSSGGGGGRRRGGKGKSQGKKSWTQWTTLPQKIDAIADYYNFRKSQLYNQGKYNDDSYTAVTTTARPYYRRF